MSNKKNQLDISNLKALVTMYTKNEYCNELLNTVYNAIMLAENFGVAGRTILTEGFGKILEILLKMVDVLDGKGNQDKTKLH